MSYMSAHPIHQGPNVHANLQEEIMHIIEDLWKQPVGPYIQHYTGRMRRMCNECVRDSPI
jgi:hypothetical protein